MEVANADGFVFKRRRKEEASTSAKAHKAPRVEEVPAREHDGYRGGARVQEEPEEVGAAYVSSKRQDRGRGRRTSFITEETSFPPYPVGGAVILPADGEDASLDEGEKLVKLCREIASTECRNVSRTFVGKTEEVSHLVYGALQSFEKRVGALVQAGEVKFLSKESRELSTRKQTMKRLVESLEQELKSWNEIEEGGEGEAVAERSYEAEEEMGRNAVKSESLRGQLATAYNETLDKIDVKVNNLCGLVKSVESLCGQTEEYAKDLQTKYHKQAFNPLPHVNSPAALIKSLLKPAV